MNQTEITKDDDQTLAPEDRLFLAAIQDEQKRQEVISILKHAGLIPA